MTAAIGADAVQPALVEVRWAGTEPAPDGRCLPIGCRDSGRHGATSPPATDEYLASRLERFGRRVLDHLNYRLEVSVLLCDGAAIRALNARYRGIDAPTDVLSFAQFDDGWPPPRPEREPLPAGDVVIAVDVAARQADARGEPVERELCRLLVHGMLHLVGMDHADPPREHEPMLTLQERTLRELFAAAAASTP